MKQHRRCFLKKSLPAAAAVAAATYEHGPLIAQLRGNAQPPAAGDRRSNLATGRIGKLSVSRLICGGNLFSGFAHSGDLLYVSDLLKNYFSDEKVLETLQLSEENGINTAVLRTDPHIIRIINRYRKERGGRIQWIAQTYPKVDNLRENIQMAIDHGAVAAFPQGGIGDTFHREGKLDLIAEVIEFMRDNGLVAGVGSHSLELPMTLEAKGMVPDFYFKTFNDVGYESQKPVEIEAFMRRVSTPWIAFKVLGAGRMKPRQGFDMAFRMGADFINVGMYDFQVAEDVALVSEIVEAHQDRTRRWAV